MKLRVNLSVLQVNYLADKQSNLVMETAESPLDVLSRAATMVQDSSPPELDDARSRPSKELPSGRWRRERRCRYTPHTATAAEAVSGDTPLDMSTRSRSARGLPPSYNQTVSAPGYRPPARPSVITCAPPAKGHRRELLSGMCDPVIDEHFRRSLGKDYMSVFSNEEHVLDSSLAINNNNEDGDSVTITGLSVDDHFAKALGDTWVKLQTQRSSNTGPTKTQRRGLIST